MHKWICTLSLLFSLSSFSVLSNAATPEPPSGIALGDYQRVNAYLDKLIRYWIDEDDITGLSIALVSDNKVTWQKSFGFANVEKELKMGPDAVYRVGAISGVFTASLILRLAELGKLQLDDHISQYLPNLQFKYHDKNKYQITIRNLLTHHAGLPISRFEGSWTEKESNLDAFEQQLNLTYASYPPNTIYAYSNIGYSLLGLIVEKVTQEAFSAALEKYVIKPLNLTHTDIRYSKKVQSLLATGYKKGEAQTLLFPRDIASLGIYSNTNDMTKLLRMLLRQSETKLLTSASIQSMLVAHNENIPLDLDKRIGLSTKIGGLDVQNGGPVVWSSGATLAFRARMALMPEHNLAVVVLSNDTRAWEALEDIVEQSLQVMLQAKAGIVQDQKKTDKIESDQQSNQILADYYTSFLGYIPVKKDQGKIKAKLLGWPLIVKPAKNGWYTLEYDLFGFIPIDVSWIADIKIKPGQVDDKSILIADYKGKKYLVGSHSRFNKLDKSWLQRQGEYRILNHDALLEKMEVKRGTLSVTDGKLFLNYKLPNWYGFELQVPLQTLSPDLAIIPGLGTALNETIKVTRFGNKEYLEYSGYLLEKIEQEPSIFSFF